LTLLTELLKIELITRVVWFRVQTSRLKTFVLHNFWFNSCAGSFVYVFLSCYLPAIFVRARLPAGGSYFNLNQASCIMQLFEAKTDENVPKIDTFCSYFYCINCDALLFIFENIPAP